MFFSADVVKLADTRDLGSRANKVACGFDSLRRHNGSGTVPLGGEKNSLAKACSMVAMV